VPPAKDKNSIAKKQPSKTAIPKASVKKNASKKASLKPLAKKPPVQKQVGQKTPSKKPSVKIASVKTKSPKASAASSKSAGAASSKSIQAVSKKPVKAPVKSSGKSSGKSNRKSDQKSTAVKVSKTPSKALAQESTIASKKIVKSAIGAKPQIPPKPQITPEVAPAVARTSSRAAPDDIVIPKRVPLPVPPKTNTDPKIVEKIRSAHTEKELRKDLAQSAPPRRLTPNTPVTPAIKGEDRIVLMVRDPYWLHAHWDISRATVDRAKAALTDQWHSVKPVLRLLKFDEVGTTESAETVYREIEIHGGVRNWYIDVDSPPSRFQVIMGYRTGSGRFYELVRSNSVTTPVPGSKDSFDDHWAEIAQDAEKIYAMSGGYSEETNKGQLAEVFEDRLKRTMELDVLSQFGSGAEGALRKSRQFHFDVEAELLVYGTTHPDAHVSIGTEPIKVLEDGTFSARLPFPDRRQVLPATARSRDGVDERTVVIAVERNTKVMEPLSIEADDL
jgi:hypothetical protein